MLYKYIQNMFNVKFKTKFIIGSIVLVLILAFYVVMDFVYQLMQYVEIGKNFMSVFWKNTYASLISMGISFLVVFICLFITNMIITRKLKYFFIEEKKPIVRLPNFIFAFVVAFIGAVMIKDIFYQQALVFLNATPFYTIRDPIFNIDLGYYFFQRPFLIAITQFLTGTWLIVILYTIIYYIVALNNIFGAVNIVSLKKYGVYTHNLINIAIFFIISVIGFRFSAESVLYSKNANMIGAGYTVANVWLKFYFMAPFVTAIIIIIALIFVIKSQYKKAGITALVIPAFWLLGLISALFVQVVFVGPDETNKEKKYVEQNVFFTKYGYNILDKLEQKDFYPGNYLSKKMLDDNRYTIDNLKVTDYAATLQSEKYYQATKSYYKFNDADAVVYDIDNKPTIVYSAARELEKNNLDEKIYVNSVFKYTHGYGMVMSPVNKVDKMGYPDFVMKNVPIEYSQGVPKISRPEIYFGELNRNTELEKGHVIVNVKGMKESDYINGQQNKETTYDGQAGIRLTPYNRIMMALKLGDIRMLFSHYVNSYSKVLVNRNVVDRAKLVAPFLDIDTDPYLIINDKGRLVWILDGYTESAYLPYSQPVVFQTETQNKNKVIKKGNYIRNSVKITVDAYDGTLKFYIIDNQDPIIRTYQKIYPEIFEKTAIPQDIARHIKYPEKLIKIQAEILKKYHIADVASLINGEDAWDVAGQTGEDSKEEQIPPNYLLMKFPDNANTELMPIIPYSLENRSNIIGFVAARSDMNNYGKIILYSLPENSLEMGPMDMENLIDQSPTISKEMEAWSKGGARVRRGDMVVVPLEENKDGAILYVQPIYVSTDNDSVGSQFKKVIVGYQGQIVMEDTVQKALDKILAVSPTLEVKANPIVGNRALIEKALKAYDEIKAASIEGDWEKFGKKMKDFDAIMQEVNKAKANIR